MIRVIRGTVRGKTIELDEDPGLAEGQEVEVQLKEMPGSGRWGEGIRRSAGGWANYPEMDAIMDRIHEDRKRERRTQALP